MDAGPDLRYARTSDDVTIAYQVIGSGPTVLWLPSLSNLQAQWRVPGLSRAYRRIAEQLRLILYDGRGMGASDRRIDVTDLGIDAHLRDLRAVIDAVAAGESVSLFGHYHAVATALAYAADHPARVQRMVLFGGAARMRDAMQPAQIQALLTLVDQDWDLFADAAANAWLGWTAGETGRLIADGFRGATSPMIAKAWFTAAADIDVTDRLRRVAAPTLVLHRQGERQIPIEVSRRLADALPNGQLLELPGALPSLFLTDPVGDLEVITRFLLTGEVHAPVHPRRTSTEITERERQVLRLLAGGESNAQIARSLGIAVHTVERHVANIYRKIGARGRADATAFALRRGLL